MEGDPRFDVIARLDRAIQYSAGGGDEPRGRSVLDAPLSRGMTAEKCDEAFPRRKSARVMLLRSPSETQRAQGMPDAGRTREPCVQRNVHFAHASNHRAAGQPAFPARWCYGLYAPSPVSGLDSHRHLRGVSGQPGPTSPSRKLDPSVGRSGPRDFAVRLRRVRLAQQKRPSHPRLTVRDDRPKRPSSSRRDARDCRGDLPDGASGKMCGRMARRADAGSEPITPKQICSI